MGKNKKWKKFMLGIFISILLLISVCFFEFNICKLTYNQNKKQSQEILRLAYNIIENKKDLCELNDKFINKTQDDIIGILKIKKINVEAPIKQGTTQEIMKTSIGHFLESDLWNGNVSLASHNSGTSMHYFENINKLDFNDEIIYITELGERKYKVESITEIKDTDWSMINKGSEQLNIKNTITLITCINGQPDYRLCVRGVQI